MYDSDARAMSGLTAGNPKDRAQNPAEATIQPAGRLEDSAREAQRPPQAGLRDEDTIAAIATPPGIGGIAILRVSGLGARRIGAALCGRVTLASHRLTRVHLTHGGEILDEAMAVLMAAPRSYTREDVLELHCHGGDTACRRVLEAVLALGARPAGPGEFTRRAFENGRIDLSQAEGAMLLIGAQGEAAARAALRQMDGAVSLRVRKAQDRLTAMLAEIAACTDFPDEIEEAPTARNLLREAVSLAADLRAACDARQGRVLAHGLDVVIAGKPNVGKSSLLNALLGETRAIVTSQPGTTRDTVHGSLSLSGVTVNLTDTAGLRAAEGEAEAMGVDRARRLMAAADLLLIVLDASAPVSTEDHQLLRDTKSAPRLVLLNKADLPFRGTGSLDSCHKESNKIPANPSALPHDLAISARTGEGIDALRARLGAAALGTRTGSALFTQARHADAAGRAAAHLEEMARALADGMPVDFAAVDAREALSALGEITGENVEESVVDAVFRDFCVGK